jgi:preprotein translocase subunit SecG
METLLIVVHVVVCLFLIGIVLLQHGKGADIGASFGGSSQTLFGTEGPVPLLNKITTASAIIFMLTSVTLAYISSQAGKSSVMSNVVVSQPAPVQEAKPAEKSDTTKAASEESPAAPVEQKEKPTN